MDEYEYLNYVCCADYLDCAELEREEDMEEMLKRVYFNLRDAHEFSGDELFLERMMADIEDVLFVTDDHADKEYRNWARERGFMLGEYVNLCEESI